jgi:hypothetical protein
MGGSRIGSLRPHWPWLACALCVVVTPLVVRLEGRPWFCKCGEARFWISQPSGPHTSQHFLDPYSPTHVEHGLLFFLVLAWLARRLSRGARWTIATLAECLWEIAENARFLIERYRQAAGQDYFGDSVVNVLGDILAFAIGYALAERLGRRGSLAALVALEVILIFWIRDSLFLNMLMLLAPIDAIKRWQEA